jgi:hypothetical protein
MAADLPLKESPLIRKNVPAHAILFAHRWVNAQFLPQPVST